MPKKKFLTLGEKLELINDRKKGMTLKNLAEKHGISMGSVSDIIKKKTNFYRSIKHN